MLTRYEQGGLIWIDLVTPSSGEVRQLMHEFGLHPLIAQELMTPSQKSKVDKHEDSIYLVLHFPTLRGAHQSRSEQEIDFVIGKNYFITARYENVNPLHSFSRAFEADAVLGRHNTHSERGNHLFASMLKNLYQGLHAECDAVSRRLLEIEERIFSGDERSMVAQISDVGRTIHDFRQILTPHREMLRSLEFPGEKLFGREFVYYLHSITGEYERVERTLEHLRESLVELRETNNSLLSTKQNEIMKTLTVLAFLFLPLSFIASMFGMNTLNNPIVGNAYDFYIIAGGMVVLAIGCFLYFKRKGWL